MIMAGQGQQRQQHPLPERDVYGRKILLPNQIQGQRSKSASKPRVPRPDALGSLVVKSWHVSNGLPFAIEILKDFYMPVLAELGNNQYLLADANSKGRFNWWIVYDLEETAPPSPKTKTTPPKEHQETLSLPSISPPSPVPSFPIDRREIEETAANPNTTNDFGVNNEQKSGFQLLSDNYTENETEDETRSRGKNQGKKATSKGWVYVPENLSQDDKDSLGELRESAYCVFHLLHLFRVLREQDREAWVDLNYDYCDTHVVEWRKTIRRLRATHILERTVIEEDPYGLGIDRPRGVNGSKSFGYRFANPAYRLATVRKIRLSNPRILDRLKETSVKYPVQRWLRRHLEHLTIEDVPAMVVERIAQTNYQDEQMGTVQGRAEAYRQQIRLIQDRSWSFSVTPSNRRINSNVTNLTRGLREYLRLDGQPLVEIDIKNSQPLFVGLLAKDAGVDCDDYLRLCEQDLYQHLSDVGGFTRKDVKTQLMQRALFAGNRHRYQRLPVKRLFDRLFPAMAKFLKEQKRGEHNQLAIAAQYRESRFIIYTVCERVRKERPECWLATIHDSVLCLPDMADYVISVMREEFDRLGVKPRLEPRELGSNYAGN